MRPVVVVMLNPLINRLAGLMRRGKMMRGKKLGLDPTVQSLHLAQRLGAVRPGMGVIDALKLEVDPMGWTARVLE